MKLDIQREKELLAKLVKDVRGNRVWLLAPVLLIAIIAVPVALSKSASSTPVAALPQAPPAPTGTALAALKVQSSPSGSRLPGRGRDPFAGLGSTKSKTTTTTTTTTTSASGSTGKSSKSSAGGASTTPSGSTAAPTSTTTAPPSITSGTKPKPAPAGLSSTQSYDVTLSITNSSGGLNKINSLERLSVLPNQQHPALVELGVLKGGQRVLFAVQPGTALNGPGKCTPGPIDCEIISLGQDQTEGLSVQLPAGGPELVQFVVTAIRAHDYSSAAAADKVRRQASAAGRALLGSSTLGALQLFPYRPNLGTVVNESTLTAGDH